MHPRVLRRQIARACLDFAYQSATVRKDRSHDRSGREPGEPHREPVAGRSRRPQELQLPPDRIDGDVHAAVVVEVGGREAAADDAGEVVPADECGPVGESGRSTRGRANVLEHLDRLRVPRETGHRDSAVGEHEIGIAVEVEVDPGCAPAGECLAKRRCEGRADVAERRSGRQWLLPGVDRMALAA